MSDADAFLAARDLLLTHRTDIAAARAAFRWPKLARFNFALDHFDRVAAGNETPALRFIGPGDHDSTVSFAAMSDQSNRVANHLRSLGVRRGDRVLLLLGNVPALWEAMLACCKLGAVVIPATTMLTEDDLRDRFDRGRVRHAIIAGEHAARFEALGNAYTRIAVGGADGWHRFEDGYAAPARFRAGWGDPGDRSATALFHVWNHRQAQARAAFPPKLPGGPSVDDVLARGPARGCAPQHLVAGLGQARLEQLLRALDRGRHDRHPEPGSVSTPAACWTRWTKPTSTTFCAPPTVWRMLIQEDLTTARVHLREALAAGEPLNPEVIEQVQRAWGLTIRDGYGQTETTLQIANTPGHAAEAGSMGWPLPGYEVALLDPDGHEAAEGEIALSLQPRPLGLMDGYQAEDGTLRGGGRRMVSHRRHRDAQRRWLAYLYWPRRRCF